MRFVLALGVIYGTAAMGQPVQIGIRIGVPITEYFDTGASGGLHGDAHYTATARRYVLGASVGWRFLEADVFFHRMGYVGYVNTFDNGHFTKSVVDVIGDSWDFPLVGKYHVHRAFLLGGGVLRYVGPVRGRGSQTIGSLVTQSSITTTIDTNDPPDLRKRFYPGITMGTGVECPVGRLKIVPEFRYTRWTANIAGEGGLLRFSPNQMEVMVGFAFGGGK
jgi:hypothetical protein